MTRTCLTNIKTKLSRNDGGTHSTAIENVWRAG